MKICPECNHEFESREWLCPHCHWHAPITAGFPSLAPQLARSGGGFEPEAFAKLAKLEAGSFWFRSRNRLIILALQKYCPNIKNFLEIGCGTGFVLTGVASAYPAMRLVGSEVFSEGLKHAAERLPTAELVQMDARNMPYLEEFEVIGAFDVLEHIQEDQIVLRNIWKALKPNGSLLLTVPQHQFLWSAVDESAHHVRRYNSRDLRKKLENAGFNIVRASSFVSFLMPLMLLSRWRQRDSASAEQSGELALPPALNSVLECVMMLERFLIQQGLNFPFGGSLLFVARKS